VTVQQVVPGVHQVGLGVVNAYLIENDGLILIDTGVPDREDEILDAVRSLGRQPEEIRSILLTHCHADHTGSLAALKRATGATAYMHPDDAALVRNGKAGRPVQPAPGIVNWLIYHLFMARRVAPMTVAATEIEHEVRDGDVLDFAGELQVIHVPGHCAGQLAFLWPQAGGVLFVADAATHMFGLGYPPIFEDLETGKRSLVKLAALDFEVTCFGHGKPIVGGAAQRFRQKWGEER